MIVIVDDGQAVQASLNNASWCDAVCRSHLATTLFTPTAWSSFDRVLPLYPNVVTLSPDAVEAQLECIEQLTARLPSTGWVVKDSFRTLDLAPLGFAPLFEAEWVHRARLAEHPALDGLDDLHRLTRGASARDLARWEEAWSGAPLASAGRTFLPALLRDDDVAFVGIADGKDLAAGLIANRAAGAIGISNFFVCGEDPQGLGAACGLAAADLWPELPLVGHASGPELEGLLIVGFEVVGGLRVWLRGGNDDSEAVHADT